MVEELLEEEQLGFTAGRSTDKQIFNSHILIEKHFQHGKDLHNNFIGFKMAFDMKGLGRWCVYLTLKRA